jgi:hypothetical protein
MYEFLLIGPLLLLFLLLIYHSYKVEGKRNTLLFFGSGLIFAFLRELIIGLTFPLYFGQFKIGPISPAIMLGWVFAFYLAHYFVRKLTSNTSLENHILVKICLGTFIVLGISLIMETTAPLLGWWSWKEGLLESLPSGTLILGAPIFVFIGWAITGATFLTIFYLFQAYDLKPKIILVNSLIFTIIMINFLIGNYFILNNPPIQFQLFYNLQFTFSLLILLAIYIKKRHLNSVYENILLFILYIFYEIQLCSGTLIFILNPFDLVYQIIFTAICVLYLAIILFPLRKVFSIVYKNL